MEEQIVKELEEIGLSEKEARVYLAALELGPATAQQIAAKAVVQRPSAYVAIESLKKRGLMSSNKVGTKKKYKAGLPNQLSYILQNQKRQIEKKEKALNKVIFKLKRKCNQPSRKLEVNIFEGIEGFHSCQEMIADSEKGEILELTSVSATNKFLPDYSFQADIRERICEKHKVKTIFACRKTDKLRSERKAESIKIDLNEYPVGAELVIFNDHVAFTTYGEKLKTLLITDEDIAKTLKVMFRAFWKK